ncbi:HesA/MoeB/ThiF family protein [Haliangium sp.]|uniref:HesA/MoeB/ThiF family protein n=1 Tax=Haliangium sp. TaxID=2663208 RepID=UPI003D1465C4
MSSQPRFHAAIVGAGGLGGPIAYALAYAGWRLTLYDHDVVELSNLQRQVQFTTADLGRPKVTALADELVRRGCPADRIHPRRERFDPAATAHGDAPTDERPVDVLIDGSDDFATKFAVNDQAVRAGIPVVIGSVVRYTGQVFARAPGASVGCYRCLFEAPPPAGEDGQSCAEAGVLGAAVAVIGGMAARAALGLALARHTKERSRARAGLWVFDDVRSLARERYIPFAPRADCPACGPSSSSSPPQPTPSPASSKE